MTKASGAAKHLERGDAELMDKTDTINAMLRPRMLIYTKMKCLNLVISRYLLIATKLMCSSHSLAVPSTQAGGIEGSHNR